MSEVRRSKKYYLVPSKPNCLKYTGYVVINGRTLDVAVDFNVDYSVRRLEYPKELENLEIPLSLIANDRFSHNDSLEDFLLELDSVIDLLSTQDKSELSFAVPVDVLRELLLDFSRMGVNRIINANDSLSEFTVVIRLRPGYPRVAPLWTYSTPLPVEIVWNADSRISDVVAEYERVIGKYQDLFAELEHLDKNSIVMESAKAKTSGIVAKRRISISPDLALSLELNMHNPRKRPFIDYFGSAEKTETARRKLNPAEGSSSTRDMWDPSVHVLDNIEHALGVDIPKPAPFEESSAAEECGICFNKELRGRATDTKCSNSKCNRKYHKSCLTEWLLVSGDTKRSFNTLFGSCVYCNKPIVVQIS